MADVRLALAWFQRPPPVVARALLGCVLVHGDRAGVIVETEAYLGPEDRASHARFGATARTAVMFGPGGVTYVYLCYGIHQMFNIVADRDGRAGAVLVACGPAAPAPRAIEHRPLTSSVDDAALEPLTPAAVERFLGRRFVRQVAAGTLVLDWNATTDELMAELAAMGWRNPCPSRRRPRRP